MAGFALTDKGELILLGVDQVSALDSNGLKLSDDGENLGVFVEDGGHVSIGTAGGNPTVPLQVMTGASNTAMQFTCTATGHAVGDGLYIGVTNADSRSWFWNYENTNIAFGTNNLYRMFIESAGQVTIGAAAEANANMTIGLNINQGGNDNEILAFKSSDVAHGITTIMETDTYAFMKKYHATEGGVRLVGGSTATIGVLIRGIETTDITGNSAAHYGGILLSTSKKSGTSYTTTGANANLVVIANHTTAVWNCDAEGDSWQSGDLTVVGGDINIGVLGGAYGARFAKDQSGANYYLDLFFSDHATVEAGTFRIHSSGDSGAIWSLSSLGATVQISDITIPATSKVYLDGGTHSYISEGAADNVYIVSGGTTVVQATPTYISFVNKVMINETVNANLTYGITINQGPFDDEILAFKSQDVAHGCTTVTETDTFGFIKKGQAAGGIMMQSLATGSYSLVLRGIVTADNTTKGASAIGPVLIDCYKVSGTGVVDPGANANLCVIRKVSGAVWHVDEDGDTWQDGNATISTTLYFEGAGGEIYPITSDGSDTGYVYVGGGGSYPVDRGSSLRVYGAEHASAAGDIYMYLGVNTANGFVFGNSSGSQVARLTDTGIFFVGSETLNANMTIGLTINQLTADNEILAFKSSDVAHGVTDETETDTFGFMKKASPGNAGLEITGISETYVGVQITGCSTTPGVDPTVANAAIILNAVEKSGTGYAAMTANSVLVSIQENSVARWAVDEDGDTWQSGNIHVDSDVISPQILVDSSVADSYPVVKIKNDVQDWAIYCDGSQSDALTFYDTTNAVYRFHILNDGQVTIGSAPNANANMTRGLTIDQDGFDDEIIAFKSSDVAHALAGYTETDTFFYVKKRDGNLGGVLLGVVAADGATDRVLQFNSLGGTPNTTMSSTSEGLVTFFVGQHDGANALTAIDAGGIIFAIRSSTGAASWGTKWQLDEDGDTWQSGVVSCSNVIATGPVDCANLIIDNGQTLQWSGSYYIYGNTANSIRFIVDTVTYRWENTGTFFINDDANTKMSVGITLQQGANDDEILSLKSSDVAHGVTDYTETDTYGFLRKYSATEGGLYLTGITEGEEGIVLRGIYTTGNTTKSAAGLAPIILETYKKVGVSCGAPGADENLVAIRGVATTVWLVDEDGDTWQSGRLGVGAEASRELTVYAAASTTIQVCNSTTGATSSDGAYMQMSSDDLLIGNQEAAGEVKVFVANDAGKGIIIDSSGAVTKPAQPHFLARMSGNHTNPASGATLIFDSEIADQGGDYNNGTYTFTAPVAGNYLFCVQVSLAAVDSGYTDLNIRLNTSNRTYIHYFEPDHVMASDGGFCIGFSVVADMDASDTATVTIHYTGGVGAQVDITGGSYSSWSGTLIC